MTRAWRPDIPAVAVPARQEERYHVLLWQVRGEADVVAGGRRRALDTGHALWVPVGVRHELSVHAGSVTMPLFFDAAETATSLGVPTQVAVDADLRTLMLAHAVSTSTIIRPGADLARQVLARLEESPVVTTALPLPTSPPARAVAEILRVDPGDARTVEELAASVHVSVRTLERAFRAESGTTLRRWRIRHRVEAASALIRAGATPAAVARRVGYTNLNAFRRVFTAHAGLTPTAYAARHRDEARRAS